MNDPSADRVLRAESLSVLCAAWIARGALELLAVRRLEGESHGSLRRGAQWRTDFPGRNDEEWPKHIDISMNRADVPQVRYFSRRSAARARCA
jgi:succinate dehydrogenase/fumarate reductase flavoprotein subunit